MATTADINSHLDTLNATIAQERQEFLNALAAKDATIADLQSQLANAITPADGDAIVGRIDQANSDVQGIVP